MVIEIDKRRNWVKAVVEPKRCKETPTTTRGGRERNRGRRKKKKGKPKLKSKCKQADLKRMFDLAAEGSDAESKCD
jgi:hypothetical protein